MTHIEKGTAMEAVLQPVFERGFDGIEEVLSAVLNFAMLVGREKALGAQPYERAPERTGYANGFKPRTLKTSVGELSLECRRTRVASLFSNEASLLRLVSTVLSEISEEWETGKIYLNTEGMPA